MISDYKPRCFPLDFYQRTRDCCFRKAPSLRHPHCLVPLAAWTDGRSQGAASGARPLNPFFASFLPTPMLTIAYLPSKKKKKKKKKVMIKHRASQDKFDLTVRVLSCLESDIVYLPYKEHDRITADTQAVTHAAFLSMGTAWKSDGRFPWENPHFVGGIENVKVNVALRIYSNKWHVYAGTVLSLAI
ncbi:hypothetical protein BC937DRAFT_91105 [Endogone sp. FLAS-F59071]|nr:hypothetical protein BC937DRAFT_91105 [Endogone sp. FLAS-F59071]|eukprot:RUS23183.1 hypothetical protein BC937DRAFT_91105 [Endogone sp. FLAS-F59071]